MMPKFNGQRKGKQGLIGKRNKYECNYIKQPLTKEEFVKTAETLGKEWDIEDVVSLEDIKY